MTASRWSCGIRERARRHRSEAAAEPSGAGYAALCFRQPAERVRSFASVLCAHVMPGGDSAAIRPQREIRVRMRLWCAGMSYGVRSRSAGDGTAMGRSDTLVRTCAAALVQCGARWCKMVQHGSMDAHVLLTCERGSGSNCCACTACRLSCTHHTRYT